MIFQECFPQRKFRCCEFFELGFEESADGEFYEVKDVNVDVIAKFRYALNQISEIKSRELGPDLNFTTTVSRFSPFCKNLFC